MKKVKVLVIALIVLMIAGSMLTTISFSSGAGGIVSHDNFKNTRASNVEHISGKFVIDQNTTDPLTGEKGKYGFDSSIIVDSTGSLIVKNATVYFLADVAHQRFLLVNGSLELYNATLTLGENQIQPVYYMNVTINGAQNQNAKVDIYKSRILYNGWFNVVNKTNNIDISNTVFDKMISGAKYGPTPNFVNSIVNMDNVSFKHLFETPSSGNADIGNLTNSSGVSVSAGGNDAVLSFNKEMNPLYSQYWDTIPVKSITLFLNYSTSTQYDDTNNNGSYIEFIYNNVVLMKYLVKASVNVTTMGQTNSSFSSADLTANQIWEGILSGAIKVVVTAPRFKGTVDVKWCKVFFSIEENVVKYGIKRFDFNMVNSTIYAKDMYVAADFNLDYGVDHNRISLYDHSTLYVLNLTVENTADKKDSCIFAADDYSNVYIFRYAKIKVMFNSIPIPGMYLNATPYLVDSALANLVVSKTNVFVTHSGYGNVTGRTIYAKTDADGVAYLPLLSDIVNRSEWPNSRYVGIFNAWVNGTNSTSGNYVNYYSMQIGVDHFPNLQVSNNTFTYNVQLPFYRHVDVGVQASIADTGPYLVGNSINITARVFNVGTQAADDVKVYLKVNGNIIKEDTLPTLNAGASENFLFTVPGDELLNDGLYNLSVAVSQVWDTNPSNNITTLQVSVNTLSVNSWSVERAIRNHVSNITLSLFSKYSVLNTDAKLMIDGTTLDSWNNIYAGSTTINYQWHVSEIAGYHTLYLVVNNTVVWKFPVYVYADVDVAITNVSVSPSIAYVDQVLNLSISAVNYGSDLPISTNVSVVVYDPFNNVVETKEYKVDYTGQHTFYLDFKPSVSGTFTISAKVTGTEDYNEANNEMYVSFDVNPTPIGVSPSGLSTFINGTNVKVEVVVTSAISDDLSVTMNVPSLHLTLQPSNVKNPVHVDKNGNAVLTFSIKQAQYVALLKSHTSVSVVYTISVASNATGVTYVFPNSDQQFYFVLKEKADFVVVHGSFVIMENTNVINGKSIAEGLPVTLKFSLANMGGIPGNLTYEVKDGDKAIKYGKVTSMDAGSIENVTFNYTMMGVKLHQFSLIINPNKTVPERSYSNNIANASLNVIPPVLEVTYRVVSQEHNNKIYEGDHIVVIVMVLNKNATDALGKNVYVSGAHVNVQFGSLGTHSAVTNDYGVARIELVAKKSGSFKPTITVSYFGSQTTPTTSMYKVEPKPFVIPWIWVILAVILIAVAIFFLYGYLSFKKEASEYMVCGNCGHLIPADAEKCPYCGAVFEKDKVQCPDCGSWIDADSQYCTVCGSVFVEPTDKNYDKYVALRDRYEQYLEKYKEEARKYIGENYKKEEFFNWWKTHPEYISFQEWIKRQEEEIEGETVKCTVCGALNPKDAKICRVCGSVLPGASEKSEKDKEKPVERMEAEQTSEKTIMEQYKEEYEKIQHPGVVSFEEWVKRKQQERGEEQNAEAGSAAQAEKKSQPATPAKKTQAGGATAARSDKSVEEKVKEGYVKCKVCGALNKPDSKVCAVCGSPLEPSKDKSKDEKGDHKPVIKKKVIKKVVTVKKE